MSWKQDMLVAMAEHLRDQGEDVQKITRIDEDTDSYNYQNSYGHTEIETRWHWDIDYVDSTGANKWKSFSGRIVDFINSLD